MLEGKGIPLIARRLREMLSNKKSVSARTVSEYDGDSRDGEEQVSARRQIVRCFVRERPFWFVCFFESAWCLLGGL